MNFLPGLNERQAVAELAGFNQVELTAIETFERSHRGREPLPDYDGLEPDAIVEVLSNAGYEQQPVVGNTDGGEPLAKSIEAFSAHDAAVQAANDLSEQVAVAPLKGG